MSQSTSRFVSYEAPHESVRRTVAQALAPSATAHDALVYCIRMLAQAGCYDLIAELALSRDKLERATGVRL